MMVRHATGILLICLGLLPSVTLSAQEIQLQLRKRAVVKGAGGPMAFNADDNRLVCVSGGFKVLTRFDVKTGKEISSVKGEAKNANVLAFTSDFKTMATTPIGGKAFTVFLWDVRTSQRIAT